MRLGDRRPPSRRPPPRRRIALQRGFLKAQGKTPEATMASALYTDVKRKSGTSIFTRCGAARRGAARAGRLLAPACLSGLAA
jgi:hypothetical protein